MYNNSCKFQIDCQLEDERSKNLEYIKKHMLENKQYKKLISQNHKLENNNKSVADFNSVTDVDYPKELEVVYYEEVTVSENNTTLEDDDELESKLA